MEPSKQVIPFFLIATIVVVAILVTRNGKEIVPTEPVIQVRAAAIESEPPTTTMIVSGTTRSAETALLRFQVGGRIDQRIVSLGDKVKAGDVLARLYNPEIQPLAQQAKNNLERLQSERQQAQRDFDRVNALFDQQAVTRQEWENSKTRLSSLTNAVSAAESELARASAVADEMNLTAPFDGRVTEILSDIGEVVQAGAPAIRLSNPDLVELKIAVKEGVLNQLSLGQEIEIVKSLDSSQQAVTGTVSEISPFREQGSLPEIIISMGKDQVAPGTPVEAKITVVAPDKIGIPIRAVLMTGSNTTAVYKVDSGKAVLTPIRPLQITTSNVLVNDGVKPGDMIVTEGIAKLFDGASIEVIQ